MVIDSFSDYWHYIVNALLFLFVLYLVVGFNRRSFDKQMKKEEDKQMKKQMDNKKV